MLKYRKLPVEILAQQLLIDTIAEVYWFINGGDKFSLPTCNAGREAWEQYENKVIQEGMNMYTLESGKGTQVAVIGDYIIRGIQGEFYPCKPDIFKATYELV